MSIGIFNDDIELGFGKLKIDIFFDKYNEFFSTNRMTNISIRINFLFTNLSISKKKQVKLPNDHIPYYEDWLVNCFRSCKFIFDLWFWVRVCESIFSIIYNVFAVTGLALSSRAWFCQRHYGAPWEYAPKTSFDRCEADLLNILAFFLEKNEDSF